MSSVDRLYCLETYRNPSSTSICEYGLEYILSILTSETLLGLSQ